jgi:type II secretory pathway component PulC
MSVKRWKILLFAVNALAAAGALAAGVAFFLAFLRQEPPKRQKSSAPVSRRVEIPEGAKPIAHFAPIWRMRALPSENQAPVVQEAPAPIADKDRIREILRGLFDVLGTLCNITNPSDSYAVLNLRRENRTETVKPGDTVSEAKVEEVRRDEVLFTYKGIANVDLPMGGAAGLMPSRPPGAPPGIPPRGGVDGAASPVQPGQPLPFTSKPVGPNHWEIDRNEVQYIQTNQTKMIDDLRPVPELGKDGKQVGVKLQNIPTESLAAQRGLQQGDIVKSVNNIPIDSTNYAELGKKIGNARTVVVTVERKGRLMNFTYTVR